MYLIKWNAKDGEGSQETIVGTRDDALQEVIKLTAAGHYVKAVFKEIDFKANIEVSVTFDDE